jgi:hypothetical protein
MVVSQFYGASYHRFVVQDGWNIYYHSTLG